MSPTITLPKKQLQVYHCWQQEEMHALSQNATWSLVPPLGKLLLAVVGCTL